MASAVTLSAVAAAVFIGPGVATADAPLRTAWFNTLSVAGMALPSTTAAADLNVAGTGAQATAYATLFLQPADAGDTLTLAIRSGAVGTPTIALCKTTSDSWASGGDQASSAGPAYDCSADVTGTVAADGTSVSFVLTTASLYGDGFASVALVPDPASTAPFSVDLGDADLKTVAAASTPTAALPVTSGSAPASAATPNPAASAAATPVSSSAASPTLAPQPASAAAAPVVSAGSVPAAPAAILPLPGAAEQAAPPITSETTPIVAASEGAPAPATITNPVSNAAPVGLSQPLASRSTTASRTDRALAVLLLMAMSAYVAYTIRDKKVPQILGGRARMQPVADAGGPDVTRPTAADEADSRGIGRFSRPRKRSARRLR